MSSFKPGRFSSARLNSGDVTPKNLYLRRREFLIGAGALAATGIASAAFADPLTAKASAYKVDEKLTPKDSVTTYNNFYEFGRTRATLLQNSGDFKPLPWRLKVDGLVKQPKEFDIQDLIAKMPLEERIYRMRCVEAWSMVIPWIGFPLASCCLRSNHLARPNTLPSRASCALKRCRAERAVSGARLALCRGIASGRSHASADYPFRWPLW